MGRESGRTTAAGAQLHVCQYGGVRYWLCLEGEELENNSGRRKVACRGQRTDSKRENLLMFTTSYTGEKQYYNSTWQ
jgi:hypothetical protein